MNGELSLSPAVRDIEPLDSVGVEMKPEPEVKSDCRSSGVPLQTWTKLPIAKEDETKYKKEMINKINWYKVYEGEKKSPPNKVESKGLRIFEEGPDSNIAKGDEKVIENQKALQKEKILFEKELLAYQILERQIEEIERDLNQQKIRLYDDNKNQRNKEIEVDDRIAAFEVERRNYNQKESSFNEKMKKHEMEEESIKRKIEEIERKEEKMKKEISNPLYQNLMQREDRCLEEEDEELKKKWKLLEEEEAALQQAKLDLERVRTNIK